MSGHTHKSAAVPFVNQKGERSMKRVKVERYVAGKEPSYARKINDDDEEYYTTDDEEYQSSSGTSGSDKADYSSSEEDEQKPGPSKDHIKQEVSIKLDEENKINLKDELKATPFQPTHLKVESDEDSDDDDPMLRILKQNSNSKPTISNIAELHTSKRNTVKSNKNVIEEDDDDEDIRQRHKLVKSIEIKKADTDDIFDQGYDNEEQQIDLISRNRHKSSRQDTEDLLAGIQLHGFEFKHKKEEESKMEKKLKDMIEQAKEEAIFTAQIHKKIEEDNKKELEMEALKKDDLNSYNLESAKTDDEDDELAYNEWKLRELKRIHRDRTTRILEAKSKSQKC